MAKKQMLYTPDGYQALVEELNYLKTVRREEIKNDIAVARSFGDLSENAEYDAARNEQAANEGEIVELEYKIKNAVILAESTDTSFVRIGTKVTVYDEDMEETTVYEITGTTEADAMNNKVSNESPVGAALLNHKVGDVVTVLAPNGEYELKIEKIELA